MHAEIGKLAKAHVNFPPVHAKRGQIRQVARTIPLLYARRNDLLAPYNLSEGEFSIVAEGNAPPAEYFDIYIHR